MGTNSGMLVVSACVDTHIHIHTHTHSERDTRSTYECDLSQSSIRGLSCLRNACCVIALTTLLTHISPFVFSFCSPVSPFFSSFLSFFVVLPLQKRSRIAYSDEVRNELLGDDASSSENQVRC